MGLANDIQALRDRVLSELNAAHDYFADTKVAWDLVGDSIVAGSTFSIENKATGTVTTHASLAGKARGYVARQLTEATFQQFITIFENFFFDLLRLWLVAYPHSLGAKKVDFEKVLDAPDKAAITLIVVDKELNELSYERPKDWFKYLNEKVNLSCPAADEIDAIAEAKATRDVLVHNRGVANKTYELKAGKLARYKDGQRMDIPDHYHRQTWELIRKLVRDICNATIAKVP
jgi:hypothetical protein